MRIGRRLEFDGSRIVDCIQTDGCIISGAIDLREVADDDVPIFFDQQTDPHAKCMAVLVDKNSLVIAASNLSSSPKFILVRVGRR